MFCEVWLSYLSFGDVRIYNYALSEEEIVDVYLRGGRAENPHPISGQSGVPRNPWLLWHAATEADSFDVYLGGDYYAVTEGTTGSPVYYGRQNHNAMLTSLEARRGYFWRIDKVTPGAEVVKGDVWDFTTDDTTVAFSDGFESGLGNWTTHKGTASLSSSNTHSGTYSYEIDQDISPAGG